VFALSFRYRIPFLITRRKPPHQLRNGVTTNQKTRFFLDYYYYYLSDDKRVVVEAKIISLFHFTDRNKTECYISWEASDVTELLFCTFRHENHRGGGNF